MTDYTAISLVEGESKPATVQKRFGPKREIMLKRYDVFLDSVKIGRVEQYLPTFESKPEGSRIVSRRWKTAHPRWIYVPINSSGFNPYRSFVATRKLAIEGLIALMGAR